MGYREREDKRADMRTREAEAEAKVRGLDTQRSQLDSKQRPLDHYATSGGARRLEEVTQRLVSSRERLQEKEGAIKVQHACTHPLWNVLCRRRRPRWA